MSKNANSLENLLGSKCRVKIMCLLAKHNELNISAIVKKAGLNNKLARQHLNVLKKMDMIQEKNFGKIRIYRYKKENVKAKAFASLIDVWGEN